MGTDCHRAIAAPIEALEREAAALTEAAQRYFGPGGRVDRERLQPMQRIAYSCESLALSTRLLHISTWLMNCRAYVAGEMDGVRLRLPEGPLYREEAIAILPAKARQLIIASIDLHDRVRRLDRAFDRDEAADADLIAAGPARRLIERLHQAF